MYSVEDLLISHGYKLPKNTGPQPQPQPQPQPLSQPPTTTSASRHYGDCRRATTTTTTTAPVPATGGDRSGHGTANGREAGACRQPLAKGCPGPVTEGERREKGQGRAGAVGGGGNQGDTQQPHNDFLSSADSGFYNGSRELYSHHHGDESEEKDVSYWRRRAQDFSLLLDYADGRELRTAGRGREGGVKRPLGPPPPPPEDRRADRQRWDESAWLRVRDASQGHWRMAAGGDRKCQSLGTEEWRPALGLGRHLSDGEGELWAHERANTRPAEGAVHPKTKGKSQSLPRVLSPEDLHYGDADIDGPTSLPDAHRLNGSTSQVPHAKHHSYSYYSFHHNHHRHPHNSNVAGSREPWTEVSSSIRPGRHTHALLPKPRFSRPLKPPSYETHQQTRGSSEMLAGDQVPKSKDGAAIVGAGGAPLPGKDYFAHEATGSGVEPPGYIPPPSYKRPLPIPALHRGGQRNNSEVVSHRFQVEVEEQEQTSGPTEVGRWYFRQTGTSWLARQRDRSAPCRKPVFPARTEEGEKKEEEERLGSVQYLPFDDPRVRHISGGPCGNSLTQSDKTIRGVDKEVPSANVLGQSTHDSAFLPPQELFLNTDTSSKTSLSELEGGNRRQSCLHKGSVNSLTSDKSCENPAAFQVRPTRQSRIPDQGFPETVTQVKKIEPGAATELVEKSNSKTAKRKLNETIFCLVSVPIHSRSNGESLGQADCENEKPVEASDTPEGSGNNSVGYLQNQSLLSTSSTDLELQALTGGMVSSRGPKKHSMGKEVAGASLQPGRDLSSGSWPGDQYRDQETQTTSSPEALPGPPQGPMDQQAQDQARSASDTTTDSGVGTDCSNRYGYPMKGQKNLNLSSNSAFSRTSNFSASSSSSQLHKSTPQSPPPQPPPPPPPKPSGNQEETDYLQAQKGQVPAQGQSQGKPLAGLGQEAFGQFLLKPVSRRPWDAIEELESFNKELQQQIVKGASVDQCIEDLDEAYRDILELGTVSNNMDKLQLHDRKKADSSLTLSLSLSDGPLSRPSKSRHSLDSWTAALDPTYREVKSAFSRPAGKTVSFSFSKPPREEGLASASETSFRDYSSTVSRSTDEETTGRSGDRGPANTEVVVPIPKEFRCGDKAALPDNSLVEAPWAARQPMQDASTLTSPPDYEDVCHALQLSRETAAVNRGVTAKLGNTGSSAFHHTSSLFKTVSFTTRPPLEGLSSKAESMRHTKKENSVPRFRGEKSLNVVMVKSQRDRFRGRGASRCIMASEPMDGNNIDGTAGAPFSSSSSTSSSDDSYFPGDDSTRFSWRKQLPFTEKRLANAKTSIAPAPPEDLSNLYEVKNAKGIPENESIEVRAARILGIDVAAESLGMMEQKAVEQGSEERIAMNSSKEFISGEMKNVSKERILRLSWQHVEPDTDPAFDGRETEGAAEAGGGGGIGRCTGAPERNSVSAGNATAPVSGFPHSPVVERPKLSVALRGEGKPGRSVDRDQDRKSGGGRGPSRNIEALRDRLATPPCRVVAERFVRMREVDSVSRIRRLACTRKSSDSTEETEDGGAPPSAEQEDRPLPLSLPPQPQLEPRGSTVAKREITLPLGFCIASNRTVLQDEAVLALSEHYDPSRVERV